MLKVMFHGYNMIMDLVPFEITSRFLTVYNINNAKTCIIYAAIATADVDRQKAICGTHDFTKLADVKYFLTPTFFLDPTQID
jgi:hypothetical protein